MGLCASAIDPNPQKVVPVFHKTQAERDTMIANAHCDKTEYCIGCVKSFPLSELTISECCGHEVCKDCMPPPDHHLCKACTHNAKAGAALKKVKPRVDTTSGRSSENDDIFNADNLGHECLNCKEMVHENSVKTPDCCKRQMCTECALGNDVEIVKCKLCEKEEAMGVINEE